MTKPLPPGWYAEGAEGPRAAVLDHIAEVWTDMRPRSLVRALEALADEEEPDEVVEEEPAGPTLVERLATGKHRISVTPPSGEGPEALGDAIERGYVFVQFEETEGGTELGVRLDSDAVAAQDGQGPLRLSGTLELDSVPVRCIAEVDAATLTGTGYLEIL